MAQGHGEMALQVDNLMYWVAVAVPCSFCLQCSPRAFLLKCRL